MKAFNDFAKEIAEQIDNENKRLHDRKIELEEELAKVDVLIRLLEPKRPRAVAYKADKGFCPRCFIHEGLSVEMKPIPSNSENDFFKCSHCSSEIEVEN